MARKTAIALLLAALAPGQTSHAFMIVPAEDAPGGYVVGVEADLGDRVPLSSLPPAFQNLADPVWRDGLVFRWRYFRSNERGEALLAQDDTGRPTLAFAFSGDRLADGDTVAAAFALTDRDGNALHTAFAAATVRDGAFAGGTGRERIDLALDFEPARWGEVGGFTMFTMKYYAIQALAPDEIAVAMRRAVERDITGGGEQWHLSDAGPPDG